MQNMQLLKQEIIDTLDMLPLEGLKLLAEFVGFLKTKFQQPTPYVKPTILENDTLIYENGVLVVQSEIVGDISDFVHEVREERIATLLNEVS